jgi:hypothetical protein
MDVFTENDGGECFEDGRVTSRKIGMNASIIRSRSHQYPLITDADYLNLLSRKLFHSGFNKALVHTKWPAFEEVFLGFEPSIVAAFDDTGFQRIRTDSRIVRHRKKYEPPFKALDISAIWRPHAAVGETGFAH